MGYIAKCDGCDHVSSDVKVFCLKCSCKVDHPLYSVEVKEDGSSEVTNLTEMQEEIISLREEILKRRQNELEIGQAAREEIESLKEELTRRRLSELQTSEAAHTKVDRWKNLVADAADNNFFCTKVPGSIRKGNICEEEGGPKCPTCQLLDMIK